MGWFADPVPIFWWGLGLVALGLFLDWLGRQ